MTEITSVRCFCGLKIKTESGFTLIEVIAALVISAIMFTVAGMGIVMSARGYMITRESAHMAQ
ncbi:type II secretion system protein J, partial [Thermodesulfobacteriota bacterium]